MVQKKIDGRGFAIAYIARKLSMPRNLLSQYLSYQLGKEEATVDDYAVGKSPMKRWKYDDFFAAVERAVAKYTKNENIREVRQKSVADKWSQEKEELKKVCRCFFFDVDVPERAPDFPEPVQSIMEHSNEMVKSFMPVFLQLDKQTAYKLQHDIQAYASVTSKDLAFVSAMIELPKEEKETLRASMSQMETVSAGTMLERLKSEEVRHWVNIGSKTYKDVCKHGNDVIKSWDSFYEQYTARYSLQALLLTPFLMLTLFVPNDEETVRLDKKRFGKAEVDLLLLFKYCLTEEAQDEVLEMWA